MTRPRVARRMKDIQPFHVMDILARARALEAQGRSIIHLEIGEPDFPTPAPIVAAGVAALRDGETYYTPALGLPALRSAIARHYPVEAGVSAARVVVTPGSSGALQLVFGTLLDPGDEVLLADPGYPCNRNFVRLFEGRARLIPVGPDSAYQLTADLIAQHWSGNAKAVLIASPANPTGTIVPPAEMGRIIAEVRARAGVVIVDEIYHGLTYAAAAQTALAHSPDVFVVNSFSKFYGMTGWRVGWLVAPTEYIADIDKLAQNIFLAASTPAQHAALAAFDPEVQTELLHRRDEFRARRDYLLPALRDLGFGIPVVPQGAFYLYADCSRFTDDSWTFALDLLEETGVAITPGRDFGDYRAQQHVRFSYANRLENLKEAVRRLGDHLRGRRPR